MAYKIRLAQPDLSGNEEKYVVDAIRSTWISSSGEYVNRFEKEFAELCHVKHAISVNNGTAALHTAMIALGVGTDDEVLVPDLTYIATANVVRYCGAEPVFVDVRRDTWCIDPDLMEQAITRKTRGIIAVHLYGHPADMDAINDIAKRHGLWVVEDAAESYLATYGDKPTGGLAKIGCFSFFGNKFLTCGQGGAITTNDDELAYRMRMIKTDGRAPGATYKFTMMGNNYGLTNIACAILCAQLERKGELFMDRLDIYDQYRDGLRDTPGIELQTVSGNGVRLSPWLFCVLVNPKKYGMSRNGLRTLLAECEIETRPFFTPMHTMPMYREMVTREYPVANELSAMGMNLPTYNGLKSDQIEEICAVIRNGIIK
jgi:perosamine synthetase